MLIAVSLWGCNDDGPAQNTNKAVTSSVKAPKSKLRNLPAPQVAVDSEDEQDPNDDETASQAINQTLKIKERCLKVLGTVHNDFGKKKKFKTLEAAKSFAINEVSRAIAQIKSVSSVHPRSKKQGKLASQELREKLVQVLAWIDEEPH